MKKIINLIMVAAIIFFISKPHSSFAYNGYRFNGQNYGTFDYRDIAPSINQSKGYMIVRLGTEETWYGKQDFVSKKYTKLNGIYKMNYDGLYTFEFYIGQNKVNSISYYNTQPPKILKVIKGKPVYEKVTVKL